MGERKQSQILVIHESVVRSWLKDAFTFGSIGALLYFNHRALGGRLLLDVLFLIFVLVWGLARNSSAVHTFDTVEEARDFVNSKEFPNEKVQYADD